MGWGKRNAAVRDSRQLRRDECVGERVACGGVVACVDCHVALSVV